MKKNPFHFYIVLSIIIYSISVVKAATITSPVISATFTKTTDASPLIILEQPAKFTFDFSSSSLIGSENLVIYFWNPGFYYPTNSSIALTNEGNKIWSLTFTPTVFFNKSAAEIAENASQFWFNIQNTGNTDVTGSLHIAFSTPVSTSVPSTILGNPSGTYALDAPVTWTFDLSNSGFKAGQDVYMYAWSPSNPDPTYINSTSISKLTYVGNMNWTMTLTPTTYFGKTVAEIQASTGFWMKLKDQAGKIETGAFNVPFTIAGNTQNFYFDFGPKDITNGDETTNPDTNGNYWNNISNNTGGAVMPLSTFSGLKNNKNVTSGYSLTFSGTQFTTNGKLHGGLLSPYASQLTYNSDLAIASATEDYVYTQAQTNGPVITFSGLNTSKRYKFKIFGSRNVSSNRTTQYTLQGDGVAVTGTLATSTAPTGLGGTVYINSSISYPTANNSTVSYTLTSQGSITQAVTYYGNNSSVYISGILTPSQSGTIALTTAASSYAYINALKIEEYDMLQVDATSISISGSDITSSGATSQMNVVYTPSNATAHVISWSVDNTSIATINSNGLLSPLKNGTITVTASFVQNGSTLSATKQITISNQLTALYLSGTATSVGDNQVAALTMNPTVGISGTVINGEFELATTLNALGTLKFYASQTDGAAPVFGAGATSGTLLQGGAAINPGISGPVLIRVYLSTNSFKIYPVDTLKISQMGSSVSFGWGAVSNHGYAYLYNQQLNQRYNAGVGANWNISNISIGGNSTVDLLNRWDSDLLNNCSKYVVYALSLANEGIIGGGQNIYDQFKNNLLLLINKAKSVGKIPIIANCYTNGFYATSEYNYVKQMNLLIHQWDVASINLLGGIDDGSGKWPVSPVNYQYDSAHPNDAGHAELFYTMVPSLYDAIQVGKAQPQKKGNTYMVMGKMVSNDLLNYSPDNTIHSFTTTFDVKTTGSGVISTFSNNSATGTLRIEPSGVVTYMSPLGGSVSGSAIVNDGQWHKITLTHYYAWGKTLLYTDNTLAGNLTEKLTPTTFTLNNSNSPDNISYREWMFYRAGMNSDEVVALNAGSMLKSSLEMYSPLDGLHTNSGDELVNMAQSTNKVQRISIPTGTNSTGLNGVKIYPNPVADKLSIVGLNSEENYEYTVFGLDGIAAMKVNSIPNNQMNVSGLTEGFYFLTLNNKEKNKNFKLNFVKK
ncbi:MAG: T9SS type A sorting domain-containing protein [Paludibacter sp.]